MLAHQYRNIIPNTDDLRNDLADKILTAVYNGENAVFRVGTSVGKSYTVATTPWSIFPKLTGGKPVVHLHQTRKAREEALVRSHQADLQAIALQGREDSSPILDGVYDTYRIGGLPVSEWIEQRCYRDGFRFGDAVWLAEQQLDQTPPWRHDQYRRQWSNLLPLGNSNVDIVHVTHPFAFAPPLRDGTVLFFDERPSFTKSLNRSSDGLTQDRIRRAVTAYLREANANTTYEGLVAMTTTSNGNLNKQLQGRLRHDPPIDWFIQTPDAHALSVAFTRAISHAKERNNGRWVGTVNYSPPTLTSGNSSLPDTVTVTLVLDKSHNIRTCRIVPDLSTAKSVIGLDAFPVHPLWELNTGLPMKEKHLLPVTKRRLWRYTVRGLTVVQVGDNANVYTHGGLNKSKVQCLINRLHHEYGEDFRTCITTKAVQNDVEKIMRSVGIKKPQVMHYGEQNSRNNFGDENVGLVLGCIDPGDENVFDRLAELDLDAHPQRSTTNCGQCNGNGCWHCNGTGDARAKGRDFDGKDRMAAKRINDAVRRGEVSQAICRYARNPDDPNDKATVFVATNAVYSAELVDKQVPGVTKVFTETQREIIDYAKKQSGTTAKAVENNTSASNGYATKVLNSVVDEGFGYVEKGTAIHGRSTYYIDEDTPSDGIVRL